MGLCESLCQGSVYMTICACIHIVYASTYFSVQLLCSLGWNYHAPYKYRPLNCWKPQCVYMYLIVTITVLIHYTPAIPWCCTIHAQHLGIAVGQQVWLINIGRGRKSSECRRPSAIRKVCSTYLARWHQTCVAPSTTNERYSSIRQSYQNAKPTTTTSQRWASFFSEGHTFFLLVWGPPSFF